jgi:hypothetical protein
MPSIPTRQAPDLEPPWRRFFLIRVGAEIQLPHCCDIWTLPPPDLNVDMPRRTAMGRMPPGE